MQLELVVSSSFIRTVNFLYCCFFCEVNDMRKIVLISVSNENLQRYLIQARSQDFAKGGLFWKLETTVNELDPNFQ